MSKIISLVIALAIVVGPTITLAQGTSTPEQKLLDRQERARSHADEVFSRLDNAIERLNKLLVRVNTRIAKEEALATNVVAAKVAAADAQKAIDNAKSSIEKFRTQVVAAATSTKPIQAFQPIKTGLKVVIADIKLAQKKIVEAIKSLRHKPATATSTEDGADE